MRLDYQITVRGFEKSYVLTCPAELLCSVMDKVELVENTRVISKKELKVPFSVLFLLLKEKYSNELKAVSGHISVEFTLCNDLNSEEFLSCLWEEEFQTKNLTEING